MQQMRATGRDDGSGEERRRILSRDQLGIK
jgi:hypothetical protein